MSKTSAGIGPELWQATRILAGQGVIDGFGHVSARDPLDPGRFHMLCDNAVAPAGADDQVELGLDGEPVRPGGPRPSMERFIHSGIYAARPDVGAIVHTHAPAFIPFGVSRTRLRPLYHLAGFLAEGAPVFDIARDHGATDMLVTSRESGRSLAACLGRSALVLMRGHGATLVGASLREAVFRTVYAVENARLQPVAMQLGEPAYLSTEEGLRADELHRSVLERPWRFWAAQWPVGQ